MHWSSAEISAWFPLLLQPYLLLLSTNSGRSSRARPHREGTHSQLLLLLLLLRFSFNPSLLCHLPQGRALYTIRHRIGQQGTKDKGTTGDKRQRDKAQQAHRHRKDNRGPKTEGQQGTKDRETNSFLKIPDPSQCHAVHEVQVCMFTD